MVIFIVWIFFVLWKQKTNLNRNKKIKIFITFPLIIITSENTKILEFSQYLKSDKSSFVSYADPECIIEKIDAYKKNP